MKIAYVFDLIYPYEIGGAQKRIWEIAKRLAQRGHDVTIFGMKYWEGDDIIYRERVRLWGVCPSKPLFVRGHRSIKQAIYFAWKVLAPLLRQRYDILDCQNFPYFPCFSAKLHSILKKSKMVITWLEVWDKYWYEYLGWKGWFGILVEKYVTRLSRYHIAISENTRLQLQTIKHRGNITMLPIGIEVERINLARPLDKRYHIVTACRLIKEKNLDILINAVGLLRESIPGVQCLIIGDGPERDKLDKLAAELGLRQNVTFTGFLESSETVFSYFKSSKVFVLPSTREGFGIVVLEANACGLPVVIVDHPRNSAMELVTEGKNGFICQLNPNEMAVKIERALTMASKISDDCIECSQKYDWDKIINMVENIYNAM